MNPCETSYNLGITRDVAIYTLLETAGIGGAHALQAILSENSNTGKALSELGVSGFALAGSITGMPGNLLCDTRFGAFAEAVQSFLDHTIKGSTHNWKDHQKISGFDDPNPIHQLLDFMTGRNADVIIYTDNEDLTLEEIYQVLVETLPLDMPENSPLIVSHALHAGRFEVIQFKDPRDHNNQGINITIANKDDSWNKQCSARSSEVVPVLHDHGYPYIQVDRGGWRVPDQLLATPTTLSEWHMLFAQELRRTALQPDRGMDIDSFTAKLRLIPPDDNTAYSHEQICLITANLARALDRMPEQVSQIIASIPELQTRFALRSNTDSRILTALTKYAETFFDNPGTISPYLVHLLAIALPVDLDTFLYATSVATHRVYQSATFAKTIKI